MRAAKLLCTLALLLPAALTYAQTGKIAGRVTDTGGDALPGVNVIIDGTTQGTTTDAEGYYTILNIRPGTYSLRSTFIGYTPQVKENVRVNIDQTTTVDFQLQEETVGMQEVVVAAERPVVQRDVSASVANLSAAEIENLPVTDIEKVIGLQAGFERGLTIRGSGGSQVQFMVDGFSMTGGLGNNPFTGISYTAVDEVQVQTGGFNAEYGNVRSGLINIVTKEGLRDRYTADVILRYAPAQRKHFAGYSPTGEEVLNPADPMSYYARPYFDPDVAMTGTTNGEWDAYMRYQYPEFKGWNELANSFSLNQDNDPTNDATPAQLQEAYKWYLRKDFAPQNPDYELDGTIGGPVPVIGRMLGDLRFSASYRQEQSAYIIPMVRDVYMERTAQGRLTSDLGPGMRLQFQGLYGKQLGINDNEVGWQNMWTGDMPYYPWDNAQTYLINSMSGPELFATHFRNPMDVTHLMLGGQFTHTLSPRTFYEVQLQRMFTDYFTFATGERDYAVQHRVGPIELNEEPFGWEWRDQNDVLGVGQRTGGHWYSARDTSNVTRWLGKFDITSQLNRFMQVKAGLEYVNANYNTNFGEVDPAHPHHANPQFVWTRQPQQGALYGQSKLEFKGMVANVGLRLDYFHASGDWYAFENYDRALSAQSGRDNLDANLEQEPTERQVAISPRLGISYPITENSKLYFNYGHFREMPNPMALFNIEEINTGAVNFIGNPNLPMQKTVMYELGYEQNLADMFLLRLAGYYRDLSQQSRNVYFESIDGEVRYNTSFPFNYGDVRGFEITLQKNRGDWVRGFLNYTYMASKGGNFGFSNLYENRVRQREYLRTTTDHYQGKPIPEPYARMNLEFLVPEKVGPGAVGTFLGDWRITLLGEWRQGQTLTWTGNTLTGGRSPVRGLQSNTRWKDFWMLDARLSKNFESPVGGVQFFVDVNNLLNLRQMHRYSVDIGDRDFERYLKSLHLPGDIFEDLLTGAPYDYVPGDDQPGDYRKPGVAYQPVEAVKTLPSGAPSADTQRAWRYAIDQGKFFKWSGSAWQEVPGNEVDQVLDDKAYIDMPNEVFHTFLNPRNFFFGIRLTF